MGGVNIIMIHNLGGFDGYFIYNYLSNRYTDELSTILDKSNKFIIIQLQLDDITITFKDSIRIFPTSLNGLCQVFGVEGKLSSYDPSFNHLSILNNV
jgi:hypothetical protein